MTVHLGPGYATAAPEDLRRYQLDLVETRISTIILNATITALRFFFGVTLEHPDALAKISPVREPRKLPVVLMLICMLICPTFAFWRESHQDMLS